MRITLYLCTILLFLATLATGFLTVTYLQAETVNASVTSATVITTDDGTHKNNPLCENFEEIAEEETSNEFDTTITYAVDQNKHKQSYTTYSSSSEEAYDPEEMNSKEKVEYLLRCQKSKTI